jgi:predicted Zn-ribbon and HTH transcriptional regulator
MESIVYKPHCGRCGYIIDPVKYEVGCQDIYFPVRGLLGKYTDVNPGSCPHCGAIFDSIEIPQPKQFEDLYKF